MSVTLKPYPEYKDSGLPWLGEIPKHWEMRRFKYLLREVNSRSSDGQDQLLSVSQYTGVTGVHPKNWTKYVRVMTGSWSPDGEKGSCHEKPTALFSRT
jgi:type I restriction enzyme S subunit